MTNQPKQQPIAPQKAPMGVNQKPGDPKAEPATAQKQGANQAAPFKADPSKRA